MRIQEITSYTVEVHDAIKRFLNLLVEREYAISRQLLESIIADINSHLFFAVNDDGTWAGMLTLGIYNSPTGKKAWIEDVVVDEQYRGLGIGRDLTNFAVQYAKEQNAGVIMLTSKPERVSANILYRKVGFEQKVTNVYRIKL